MDLASVSVMLWGSNLPVMTARHQGRSTVAADSLS